MRFSQRAGQIKASGIRELFDKAQKIPGAIDLSIGQADFEVPEAIREATIDAIRAGSGRYSSTQGYPDLLAATRRYAEAKLGATSADEILMTSGAAGAITLAVLALIDPGDEVLLPDPFFVLYERVVRIAGGVPVFYDLYPDFHLDAERIREKITDRTRLLLINTPSNPTGMSYGEAELREVAALAKERGIPVLSDELYDVFVYDAPHVGIKRFLGADCLLVGGFSKTYAMAGWRLGWTAGPPELIDKIRSMQQFTFVCPPTLVQKGALAAFDVDMSPHVAAYRRKRDRMYAGLVEAGYQVTRPNGSFYLYPRVPNGTDMEFCERALEQKLIIVPGSAFSRRNDHFRISFSASDETLERGLEILGRLRS